MGRQPGTAARRSPGSQITGGSPASHSPGKNASSAASYRPEIQKLLESEVEIAAIYQRLTERRSTGSYAAVYRLARQIKPAKKHQNNVTRVERQPGQEAQVDFEYAGRMPDPETSKLRKSWAFVMTLAWSRHQYVGVRLGPKGGDPAVLPPQRLRVLWRCACPGSVG